MNFLHTKEYLLDAIFPKRCLGCKTFDTWLCDDCHKNLSVITQQHCPLCKDVITPEGETCVPCKGKNPFDIDGVFVASTYSDPLLKKAVHAYKYRFLRDLSAPLALLLAQALRNSHLESPDIIISVPLHNRRLRWRGFNQAQILATDLDLLIPQKDDLLRRKRYTKSQVKTGTKSKRLANLEGAFVLTDDQTVKNKKILLIDDVITTGTTLNECAKVLKKAGAQKVTGLVLARE